MDRSHRYGFVAAVLLAIGPVGAATAHEMPDSRVQVGEVRDSREIYVGEAGDAAGVEVGEVRDIRGAQLPVDVVGGSGARLRDVELRGRFNEDGSLSGVIANRSGEPVRDIQLLIEHSWLWADEFHPGESGPGRARYVTVPTLLPPDKSVEFRYQPVPPLPYRSDGRFETTAEVVGFDRITYVTVPGDRPVEEGSGLR
jgi:hypothetical protein